MMNRSEGSRHKTKRSRTSRLRALRLSNLTARLLLGLMVGGLILSGLFPCGFLPSGLFLGDPFVRAAHGGTSSGGASERSDSATWRASVAETVITPAGPMWMAGYASRNHPADGTSSDLYAKALVLEDAAGRQALLITLDLVGVGRELTGRWCRELQERHGLERNQIAVCTSHTHSGPIVGNNLGAMHYRQLPGSQQQLVDQYVETLTGKVLEVAGRAFQQLRPARLTYGSGRATFAVNRRNNIEAQVPQLRVSGDLQGPVDHDVPVLKIEDSEGQLLGVVFGYACHATVLSWYQWSGDYPGHAQAELQQRHPGCVALFWAGCGGDQNPLPRRTLELAQDYGRQLADAVDRVLDAPMQPIQARLTTEYREVDLAFGVLPTADELRRDRASDNRYVAERAAMWLDELDAGRELPATYPYPIGNWQLGEQVDWIFLGGEVVVDYADQLKRQRRAARTWVAAYANDVMAYIPSLRVLREGGYEGGGAMVYYGLPAAWSEAVETTILEAVPGG